MEKKSVTEIEDEKKQKALLKAQRKAEFEAKFKKEQKNKENVEKSKAQLKAERRAIQETQRAAKVSEQHQKNTNTSNKDNISEDTSARTKAVNKAKVETHPQSKVDNFKKLSSLHQEISSEKINLKHQDSIISNKEIPEKLFSHLPRKVLNLDKLTVKSIPPTVIQVGYQLNKELIESHNARCVSMLIAFKQVIEDSPVDVDIKDLQKILFNDCQKFLARCRPLSISMINALKHLKLVFTKVKSEDDDSSNNRISDQELKKKICFSIDTFIEEEILCSLKAIHENSLKFFSNSETQTILTLGCSSIMKSLFQHAKNKGKQFQVVVADTKPRCEGQRMVEFLVSNEIPVTYLLINSVPYVMKEITKVMFEAHSILCNGYVMSDIGASQIALVAKAYNVPVIVCCETYKFSERVDTDCFLHNELGDDLNTFFENTGKKIEDEAIESNLNVLDVLYDLTPHEFVSGVITEKGTLPCASVPAILRVREKQ